MMMPQPYYIYWVGHLAKSVKEERKDDSESQEEPPKEDKAVIDKSQGKGNSLQQCTLVYIHNILVM